MILSETFEAKEKNEEETTREGNLEVEVGDLFCPSYLNTSTFTCPSNSFTDLIQGIYIKNKKSIKSRQDENGTLFQTDLPEIGDDNAALLAHTTGASGSTDGAGAAAPSDAPVVGSTSGIMSFK